MKELVLSTTFTLRQLTNLLSELSQEEYNQKLEIINGNTIGKHCRHIVELFGCLINGIETKVVDYDNRQRDINLETDKTLCLCVIEDMINAIMRCELDATLFLVTDLEAKGTIRTSLKRELLYNQEHTIHHLAIIGIVVRQCFKKIVLEENFGVARSTIRHQQQVACAQ